MNHSSSLINSLKIKTRKRKSITDMATHNGKSLTLRSIMKFAEDIDLKLNNLMDELKLIQDYMTLLKSDLEGKASISEVATHQLEIKAELSDIRQSINELIE